MENSTAKRNYENKVIMVIGKNLVKVEIKIDGRELEQANMFKYVGVNIHIQI